MPLLRTAVTAVTTAFLKRDGSSALRLMGNQLGEDIPRVLVQDLRGGRGGGRWGVTEGIRVDRERVSLEFSENGIVE